MLFWILGGAAIWLIGAIIFAALDGWFDYGLDDGLIWASVFWFIVVPLILPFVTYDYLHKKFAEAKQRQKVRIAAQEKIRVEAEKELEKIEAELDGSLSQETLKTK